MADGKDILIGAGALIIGLLIVNWLTTPKPPQWPSGYGFAYSSILVNGAIDYGRL